MPEPDRFAQRTKMPSPRDSSQWIGEDQVARDPGVSEGAGTPAQSAGPTGTVGPALDRHDHWLYPKFHLTPVIRRVVHTIGSGTLRVAHIAIVSK